MKISNFRAKKSAKRSKRFSLILILLCITLNGFAYDLPPVNLGFTSFLDGGPPAGPGWYFQDYLRFYNANRLTDNKGDNLPLPKHTFQNVTNLFQLIYQSQHCLIGGQLGIDVILPWLMKAEINDGLHHMILDAQTGIGDLTVGPFLQFGPYIGPNGPIFAHRFEFDIIVPTGRYSSRYAVNPGSHFWSINPYWAATRWFTPKWTASIRAYYLWNGKNNSPNFIFGPAARNIQAGQAFFANYATEYEIREKLRVGINGYVLYQINDTTLNGDSISGRRERVWAIGPGLLYTFSKESGIFFNTNYEFYSRNRPQGYSLLLRYYIHL